MNPTHRSRATSRRNHSSLAILLLCSGWQATTARSQTPLQSYHGTVAEEHLGGSVRDAGDVNGDVVDDLIVGSWRNPLSSAHLQTGKVNVFSGADGLTLFSLSGTSYQEGFGASVSGTGDVNGDGFDDFIVGAYRADHSAPDAGRATVYSGVDGSVLYAIDGANAGDWFGRSVSGAGDVNGDGLDDFIVGAPNRVAPLYEGSAYVYSGATGSVLYAIDGSAVNDHFGSSVSGAGDVDGDGFDDFIVGADGERWSGPRTGGATVFSGRTGAVLHAFRGPMAGSVFGCSVDGAGDVNDDGFADLIVGAPLDDSNGSDSGSTFVYSGIDGALIYTFLGEHPAYVLGRSVSAAGDVDGDGYDDVIVGGDGDRHHGYRTGAAHIFSGFDGARLFKFTGDSLGDQFGYSVSGAGDIDGDGFDDVIVGARMDDASGHDAGRALVFTYAQGGRSPVGLSLCPAVANSTGDSAHMIATGSDSVASNNLVLHCRYLPQRSLGYFLNSASLRFILSPAGSAGNLCIAGQGMGRFVATGQVLAIPSSGAVALAVDLTRFPRPAGPVAVMAGETWNFQFWFRDNGRSSNFSDALQIEFR